MMKGIIPIVLAALVLLSGCASIGGDGGVGLSQKIADKVVKVDERYRPLRVCLMAAGMVEVMTDRVQTFDSGSAPEALGRLMALQGAIDTAKLASPLWVNTDMADVSFRFAAVLKDAGQSRLSQILLAGPSLSNLIDIAKRATLMASKGDALLVDINSMLSRVQGGTLTAEEVWAACEERMALNRRVLITMSGIRAQ